MAVRQRPCRIFVDDTVSAFYLNDAAMTSSKWILSEIVVGRNFNTIGQDLSILEPCS